jgi:translation initiation factor 1 (eIF-1/SUI1)
MAEGFQVPTALLDSLKGMTATEAAPQVETEVQEQPTIETQGEELNENPTQIEDAKATQEEGEEKEPQQQVQSTKEELLITGPDGRKQKVEVDWNDKEKLKKYIHAAAGMRKFQAERDNALRQLKEKEAQYSDVAKSWQAIQGAYEQEGFKGLVNLLTQNPNGYELFLNQELSRMQRRLEATPEELKQLELEEKYEQERKAREKLEKKVQETLEQSTKEKEAATIAEIQSRFNPVFDRYRFEGKLGDPEAESVLDSTLWEKAKERLAEYPDDTEITPQLIEREFRTVANTLRKVISKQAEKKTEQVIQNKKQQAATQAAAIATKGYQQGNVKDSIRKSVESNDMLGALKQFLGGGR